MRKFTFLAASLLLVLLANTGIAQPVFVTTQENIDKNVKEIFEIYGDQISISFPEVRDFVRRLLTNTNAEVCAAPYPKVRQISTSDISFYWDPIPEAKGYDIGTLNLNTAGERYYDTTPPGIVIPNGGGLVMFGFQTKCANVGQGRVKSAASIIIADLDMIYPVPPLGQDCNCLLEASYALYPDGSETKTVFPISWPGKCSDNKYRVRVHGEETTEFGQENYYSEISFVHVKSENPNLVFLLNNCDINAYSSAAPFNAGDEGVYNTSFTNNIAAVEIAGLPGGSYPNPNLDIIVDEVFFDVCGCDSGEEVPGDERSLTQNDHLFNRVILFPNPVANAFNLFVDADKNIGPVVISIVDLLGNQIVTPQKITPNAEGQIHLNMNTENWSSGIYHININGLLSTQTIRFSKI